LRSKFDKYLSVACGLSLIYLGLLLIRSPYIKRVASGFVLDTSGYNVPLGIFTILIGIAFTLVSINAKVAPPKYYICPQCEATFGKKFNTESLCNNCNCNLVEIEEFYRERPENT